MKRHAALLITATLGTVLVALAVAQAKGASPRYATAVRQELESMGLQPNCVSEQKARYHCTYAGRASANGRKPTAHAVYSDESDTVYFYIERYLDLPAGGPKTQVVLQRLMELNWDLLLGKLEWNPRSGEVRLSAVLSTDSNFDRRAFRSIVHGLDTIAERFDRELHALAAE
jgi:hypothetical protein